MISLRTLPKQQRQKLLKASLLKPMNVLVLTTGILAGTFSGVLIPVGIVAYGVLCYLDLSSDSFFKQTLKLETCLDDTRKLRFQPTLPFSVETLRHLEASEIRELQQHILTTFQKITRLYEELDDFTKKLWGELAPVRELVERSGQLLHKAQHIKYYLDSEQMMSIQDDIAVFQKKIDQSGDPFVQTQYQHALNARKLHLTNIEDIQRSYERFISQLTNISISLDSLHSRMMKLSTTEQSVVEPDSGQITEQLHSMLHDMELLDAALDEQFSFTQTPRQTP
ncbi:hypothetical protein CSA56_15225 [candidate division KSB3 bacterium]|uniref:Uncharacterized protein n=1 Tax=candidate division KSB3 bacterium TaxID=2044937 RepID=A0A2G6KC56_9BACT|nr:MAG: hypothetical protein CSA56_15225 [candidate division KSB3 bacterium]